MRHFSFLIILLGIFLIDPPYSVQGQDSKTIWFAPLPPLPQHEGRPFIGSLDFMNLFTENAPWARAAERVQVFKLYGEWVAYNATDEQLRQVVADLNRRNIAIAVEEGPLIPTNTCGSGIEGFAGLEGLLVANRIKAAGGTLRFVALDEPFFYGSLYSGPNACNWPAEKIAQDVASYIQTIKSVFPDVVIGDIEPLTRNLDVKEYKSWLDTYQTVTGSNLPFLHLDLDYQRPDWPQAAKELEIYVHGKGVQFGIIYIGDYHDTDAEWFAHAEARMARYETEVGGQPDHVIFQSWVDKPDYCLPETNLNSFTHLINLYFRTRTILTISPNLQTPEGFREIKGTLIDSEGKPVTESPVELSVKSFYRPSALEPSVILVDTTITDLNGSFLFTLKDSLPFSILLQAKYPGKKIASSVGDGGYWPTYADSILGLLAENIARNEPISASKTFSNNLPEMATDGNFDTIWNSDFPPQWIEVNLQEPFSIWLIRMAVSQFPEGQTVHRLWGKGPNIGQNYQLLHEFNGFTKDPQVLEYISPTPLTNLQFIKIETMVSPSWVGWREIDIVPWLISPPASVEQSHYSAFPINPALKQNFPNPFNLSTTIEYKIQFSENVKIQIYNTVGQLVRTLVDEAKPPGIHRLVWDGKDDQGQNLASGIYFYHLHVGDFMKANRMILLK